ncbi:FG-GAP-like repeat-containing protein [Streptosporangium sp. V21-05]|uniref:CRTAC1 family protein n=1 Tax=Streptosporangium sp. V21-05 TaxID=3446115 RepID=UPI003F53BB7B
MITTRRAVGTVPGVRRYAAGVLALVAATAGWRLTALPDTSAVEASADFSFHARRLGPPAEPGDRVLRPVAPGYANLRSRVSALGAGVALFDVDDEIVADDLCLVDPRRDTVTVRPAPGTSRGYRPFTLVPPERGRHEAPTGCLPADLDQDGWEDLVVYYWGRSPSLFLRVPGTPPSGAAFRHRALTGEPEIWNTSAATAGDFDGDGRLDLVFGNYFPDGVRVLGGGADHGDAVMPDSLSAAANGGGDRLYRATGPALFTEAEGVFDEIEGEGGGGGWTLALGTQDLDGDGRPELYVANDFGPDHLLVNESVPGRIRFTEARGAPGLATPHSRVLGRDSFKGMGVAFTDLNADGRPDILVSNLTGDHAPHESNFAFVSRPGGLHEGHAPYDDLGEELGLSRGGWSWDVKAADFDNDGVDEIMHATGFVRGEADRWARLREASSVNDLLLSHPSLWPDLRAGDDLSGRDTNTFFTRGPDGRYVDVARRAGVSGGNDDSGDDGDSDGDGDGDGGTVGRAFAVGDVDDDGRLDFAVANQWSASVLYRNHGPTAPFVGLRLRLPAGACGTPPATPPARTRTGQTPPEPTRPGPANPSLAHPEPASPGQAHPRSARPEPVPPGPTRAAVGAVATVRLPGGVTRSRQLYPANGHNGVSAPELLFGLGDDLPGATVPVEISWRDACGGARTASLSLEPGWHRILLAGGRASEIRRR